MSHMTRAVTALAVLTLAAIPVAALTIKNNAAKDATFAVDNGTVEKVYTVPAGGSAEVTEDCSSGCAVTGPWGYSRLVSQNDTFETDGTSLVTHGVAPEAAAAPAAAPAGPSSATLVPENPAEATDTAATAETPAPNAEAPRKRTKVRRAAKPAPKGSSAGSFEMLFSGK